ncbi:MAG: hypothetical protein LC135_06805 [Phycisphaerae bacterium]|nr:hypothetical protein [Phycisphaerae bacterium]MCZ2399565.1 hypothetical protein [Phycisphaerae bacterium]NUQ49440.1 hypothetical protein [Phycisphaerae bacterium]
MTWRESAVPSGIALAAALAPVVSLAVSMAAALSGCGGGQPPLASPAAAGGLSPRQVLERLVELRQRADYRAMEALIVTARRHETIRTLAAVDDFLAADRDLGSYVRRHVSIGASLAIESADWAANLEIFSRYVEFRGETVEGDSAEVTFQVDRRLPLKVARLRRVEGVWQYDPGPGYQPELPAAFHKLARGLRQVLDDLRSGRLSAEECAARPERLVEEVKLRLTPGVQMLPAGARE